MVNFLRSYFFLLIIFQFGLNFLVSGQTSFEENLNEVLNKMSGEDSFMGSIVILHNGEEIYQFTSGVENPVSGSPLSQATTYRIGSVTKTFTAAVILQLVEESGLTLGQPLSDYFSFPGAGEIAISSLLRHSSGLSDEHYAKYLSGQGRLKLLQNPEYANVNYVLLAEIAEQVEGKSFGDILEERVFGKCGLGNIYYGDKASSLQESEALSFRWLRNKWVVTPANSLDSAGGAGGIATTTSELGTFYDCLFRGKLLQAGSVEEMCEIVAGYGCGLMKGSFKGHTAFMHSGAIDGFQAYAAHFPDSGYTVAMTLNGVRGSMNEILIEVLEELFD